MLDALILAPANNSAVYQELSNEFSAIENPIWAQLLTGALIQKGKNVLCVDQACSEEKAILKFIDQLKPHLIVLCVYGYQPSASTQNMHAAQKFAALLKESQVNSPILLVGAHPSALPEETLQNVQCEYVAKGEGLNTILGLLEGLEEKAIPGLFYREDEYILKGPLDKMAENLDETYPSMVWDLLPMDKYRACNWHAFGYPSRDHYASVYTSLGCPFKCSFCMINAPFDRNAFRYWDPKKTAKDIQRFTDKYGIKHLKIADEMFVLNENHFLTLCDKIIDRKLDLNIWAYARVDTVKPRYLEKLKRAGVNWLALGIESGSKHVRDGVIKGRFGMEDIRSVVSDIKSHGINVIGNYIFGLPDDTEESMRETYELSCDLNCEFANFYSAMAYPGSRLYQETEKKNLPESYIGYSQHAYETKPLPTKTVEAWRVLEIRDKAFEDYFQRESYQDMIEGRFGKSTKEEIKKMLTIKLKRKIIEARK